MSAILNNSQHTSGFKIGADSQTKAFITLLSLALIGFNAVHMHDYALNMFVNNDTWLVKEISIRLAAVGLAFLEIVIGGVFVYLYRTSETRLNGGLILTGFLALVVALMAVIAGNGSQQTKADVKSNLINSHDSKMLSLNSKIEGAKSELDISLRMANQIKDPNQRAIEKDRAKLNYQNTIARLNTQKSEMQTKRPIQAIENGSVSHYVAITIFSVLCSFGALFLSGYSAAFLKPLVAIPAFTLVSKLRHAWSSDGSDFQNVKHEVSPIGGMLGAVIGTQKLTKKALPQQDQGEDLTGGSDGDTDKRPHVEDTMLGAFSSAEGIVGGRSPNDTTGKPQTVEYSEGHYDVIKSRIAWEEIKPTQKPVKAALVKLKVRFVDDAARQKKAVEILDQLKTEGVILNNPDFGKSGQIVAKYILNPDYSENDEKLKKGSKPLRVARGEVGAEAQVDEVGDYDLVTVCPNCQIVNSTDVLKIEKRKGTVKCIQCSKGHVATSHQFSSEQSYFDMLAGAKNT